MGDIWAAVAAVAALATLFVAYLTLREGRSTIVELRKVAGEAAKETAAQEAIVESTRALVKASETSTTVLHSIFLETQAAREIESLLRVRSALAEVAYATQRAMNGQPEIVFYGARQTLRAALAGVLDAETILSNSYRIGHDASVVQARQNELQADHEVDVALGAARRKLAAASLLWQASESVV